MNRDLIMLRFHVPIYTGELKLLHRIPCKNQVCTIQARGHEGFPGSVSRSAMPQGRRLPPAHCGAGTADLRCLRSGLPVLCFSSACREEVALTPKPRLPISESNLRTWGRLGFRVWGLGFRVSVLGFRALGFRAFGWVWG